MNGYYRFFFTAIFVYCLFSFKINLIGEIRFDDFLAASLLPIFIAMNKKWVFIKGTNSIILFVSFVVFSVLSTLYNSSIGRIDLVQGLLFSIRNLEYIIFIVLGFFLAHYQVKIDLIFKVYIFYALILISAQSLELLNPVSKFSPDRAIANTGGPWELAAVSAFLIFYFLEKKEWIYFFLAGFILILTESRITNLSVLLVLLFILLRYQPLKFIIGSVVSLVLILGYQFSNMLIEKNDLSNIEAQPSIITRVEQVFSSETLSNISNLTVTSQAVKSQDEYFALTYGDELNSMLQEEGDVSALIRFSRWSILIPTTLDNFDSSLIGLGPSFAGKAVDGNYTRLFIETGVMGLVLYLVFFFSLLKFVNIAS